MSELARLEPGPAALPVRDASGAATMALAAELPVADAELAVVALGFALVADGDHAWAHHDAQTDLVVRVTSEAHGAGALVRVRVDPIARLPPRLNRVASALAIVYLTTAIVVLLAQMLLAGTLISLPGVYLAVLFALGPVSGGILLALAAVRGAARRRQQARWISAWHRRFWPALAARLEERPPYR